jgi:hypothetical protein
VIGLFTACNGGDEPSGDDGATAESEADSDSSESGTETGDGEELPPALGQFSMICEEAPTLSTGYYPSSLRARPESFGGACGLGGPQLFFSVEVQQDADLVFEVAADSFAPRLELLSAQCVPERSLACSDEASAAMSDLRAGTRIVGSVGIDPSDPALTDESLADDPLAFELKVELRAVFAQGQVCGDHLVGRCTAGTRCADDGAGVERCVAVAGDTCARALPLDLPEVGETLNFEVDLDSEAGLVGAHHLSSCGGGDTRELVYRLDRGALEALAALAGEHRVELSSPTPGVLAAARGPGCRATAELGCAEEISNQALSLDPATLAGGEDGDVHLIVEVPNGAQGVISLALAVVDA